MKITETQLRRAVRHIICEQAVPPGTLFRTPAGSELAVTSVNYHPYTGHGEILDSVDFEVKSIEEDDITGYEAFFYERPDVGQQINIIASDLNMVGWPEDQ